MSQVGSRSGIPETDGGAGGAEHGRTGRTTGRVAGVVSLTLALMGGVGMGGRKCRWWKRGMEQ